MNTNIPSDRFTIGIVAAKRIHTQQGLEQECLVLCIAYYAVVAVVTAWRNAICRTFDGSDCGGAVQHMPNYHYTIIHECFMPSVCRCVITMLPLWHASSSSLALNIPHYENEPCICIQTT